MAKMTMVIDLDRCVGCYACEIACKQENDVALGLYWNKVETVEPVGEFPDIKMYWLPTMCQQCESPTCVSVCPTGASYQRENGVVLVDPEVCIGCKLCMDACPYGARSFDERTQVVGKCTTCASLRESGSEPACVKCCTAHARIFGDIDDPESEVSKALAQAGDENVHAMHDEGTGPSVRYILHEKTGTWQDF